ncbi:Transporter, LysE family [Rubellimicrobium mesophilum DSM 19309]|uniref:Transporter, LysE family n=1 Tax=Rubellimicrobium mesophilum DSM 19309 TaxID=442562 RepID=A0A017HL71_9RHOB|nr:LysE family translocator [Rubellimicrobium mesophilum]EYD75262.1 Transporter, LysE family [Rubellimicrobium mesophilum DSM 19309]
MTTLDLLPALAGFAFVSLITPGPNNLMLMTSGANFGVSRTVPHIWGVALGFSAMIVAVGLGLSGLFHAVPGSQAVLKAASVAYLLWLAWRIASSDPHLDEAKGNARPMTFLEACAFQWVNPKGWAMALTACAAYTFGRSTEVVTVALVFLVLGLPSVWAWAALGQEMRRFLTSPARLRAFNVTMAALLVATLWPILKAI